jgi:NADPH-dependent 2,4-dienoyl-CoA reductase/sulfur reductase-like enzyme
MGKVFADLHREHGVDLRLGSTDLSGLEADAVVVGVGVRPRTELAEAAGLDVDNGVLVDASLRTSDPDIYAVGDIANHDHPVLGHRVRVEHWATALNHPATAAATILGGSAAYDRLPYFFSDQYDLGMEYVGHATREDTARVVTRGDVGNREFVAFWLDDQDRILAAMNVNVWDVPDEVKPLIAGHTVVDVDKLTDPDTKLADVGR